MGAVSRKSRFLCTSARSDTTDTSDTSDTSDTNDTNLIEDTLGRGSKQAAIAVGHSILVIYYQTFLKFVTIHVRFRPLSNCLS
jgi:hypothetical protein